MGLGGTARERLHAIPGRLMRADMVIEEAPVALSCCKQKQIRDLPPRVSFDGYLRTSLTLYRRRSALAPQPYRAFMLLPSFSIALFLIPNRWSPLIACPSEPDSNGWQISA